MESKDDTVEQRFINLLDAEINRLKALRDKEHASSVNHERLRWKIMGLLKFKENFDLHDSDCATHNEPAYPNEPCDCYLSKSESANIVMKEENKTEYAYIEIPVEKELPEMDIDVTVIASKFGKDGVNGHTYTGWLGERNKWHIYSEDGVINDYNNNPDYWQITHWLKKVPISSLVEAKADNELDTETIKAIEEMADNDFAAMEAMDFAEWLKENNMSPNGFGGWGCGEINTNLYGSKTEQLYDLFKRQQHKEFKKKVEERRKHS